MKIKSIQRRSRELRKALKKNNLNGLVVTKCENVRYLTGFSGHDSWAVVLGRSVTLITDSRYTEQAQGECLGCKIVERRKRITETLADFLATQKGIKRVGVENTASVALKDSISKALRKGGVSVKAVCGLVETLRMVKEESEVGLIRKAAGVAWAALEASLKRLKAGMTEMEFTAALEYEMKVRGAVLGFDTIVAFGPNGSRNHHQPGMRRLRKKDTILIDFGAKVGGYTCDITRSFAFGGVSREYERAWQTVYAAQQAAIGKIRAGAKLSEVDAAAREVINQSGFPVYGHGSGHGMGLEVHESPFLSAMDKKGTLEAGHVITVEPGIYLPGKFGIRIEDDVLVTETGAKVLTEDKKHGFGGKELICL